MKTVIKRVNLQFPLHALAVFGLLTRFLAKAEFRQRRAFFYLSGCNLPDSYVTYHLTSRTLTLYIPPLDPAEVVWCGLPLSPEQAMQKYDVDAVRTTADLESDFELAASNVTNIFAIAHKEIHPALPRSANTSLLHDAINECRVTKSPYEVALIRRANQITAGAHRLCMSSIKKSKNERELQGLFLGHCIASGAPGQAYTGIFGAGKAAATLHYIHNNASLEGKQLLLLDAGCEYDNYASDVTRTFPISGEFTKEGRQIYDIVLKMQKETMAQCKAGNNWDDIHTLAHRVAIQGLLDIGVLHNGTVDEILESRTSTAFLPHGLGHYLGMDTHDTGGHPNYQDKDKMFCYLRKRGPLPTGAVITVEPGLYFCEFIIKPFLSDAKHSKYINAEVLEKYWDVGGVRIEGE